MHVLVFRQVLLLFKSLLLGCFWSNVSLIPLPIFLRFRRLPRQRPECGVNHRNVRRYLCRNVPVCKLPWYHVLQLLQLLLLPLLNQPLLLHVALGGFHFILLGTIFSKGLFPAPEPSSRILEVMKGYL